MIVCDASGLYDAYDEDQPRHQAVIAVLNEEQGPFLLSPFVLAELDYLVLTRLGTKIESRLLDDVAKGAYELCTMTSADVTNARKVISKYSDLKIGLADASNVVIAGRYETTRILTFDHRHFRAVKPLVGGDAFELLPTDA